MMIATKQSKTTKDAGVSALRVFVSSTMEDLANERQAVIRQIEDFGLEVVNAEGLMPSGATSWDRLENELSTCHMLVLILGERYGWIPDKGFGAGGGKSVTHLEVDFARSLDIPILPFEKRLKYGAASKTDDAKRRDAFRKEIGDWEGGHFLAKFDLAIDLGEKVRKALLDVLKDSYLKRELRRRAPQVPAPPPAPLPSLVPAPPTATRGPILLAGAGLSIAAGYPTAASLAEILGERLGLEETGAALLSRHSFADIAAFAETNLGRDVLVSTIAEVMDTVTIVQPTSAHRLAVQKFTTIFTTNYDRLFERACDELGLSYVAVSPIDGPPTKAADVTIFKIDGSVDRPDTLTLTHGDVQKSLAAADYWSHITGLLEYRGIVVMGHSLRDAIAQRLLEIRNRDWPGVYVTPFDDRLDAIRLHRHGLDIVVADAVHYLQSSV